MNRWVAMACLGLVLTGCGDDDKAPATKGEPEPKVFTISGALRLTTYDGVNYESRGKTGESCWGESGYDDITGGAQVVVRDSTGEQIGLGRLEEGALPEPFNQAYTCEFEFTVEDVPDKGDGLYTVEVSHRGQVTFEKDEAGDVTLSLG